MNKIIKSLAIMTLGAVIVSCNNKNNTTIDNSAVNNKKMAAAVENYVPNVVYSTYKALAEESEKLYNQLNDASEKGVKSLSQKDFDEICTTFLKARQYWEKSEAFLYGPATTFGIDPHIDTWPLDLEALATALNNSDQVEMLKGKDGITYAGAKLGQELLGFHGIEFILFRNGKNRTVSELGTKENDEAFAKYNVSGEQELIYATAVAGDLRDNCYRLYASWNPDADKKYKERMEELEVPIEINGKIYGENMLGAAKLGSSFASWEEVISTILLGGCSNICAEVADVKMGNAHSGENKNYIESPYSEKSFEDFIDNILSIQYSLYGSLGAEEPSSNSIYTLFKELGYDGTDQISVKLKAAIEALKTCEKKGAFVNIYADSSVQDAMNAVSALDAELNKAAKWIVKL